MTRAGAGQGRALPPGAWVVPAAAVGSVLPLGVLLLDAFTGQLGANPLQRSEQQTGVLALALLLLSLTCTPLRLLAARVNVRLLWPARVRKTLGLSGALYAFVHLIIYGLDRGFNPAGLLVDAVKRPYITVGLTALLLLIPLVLTSRKDSVKRLGFVRWQRLHRLSYVVAALGVLHFWWSVKKDHSAPLLAVVVLLALFAVRAVLARRRERQAAPVGTARR
ncbi:ferric reductase-like transmembrane domain-containing protein [Deinococcus aquiradiocola]|uniref:ferric reductase-like transmembrane domain-containing protein n=1 Tax=Deinococcus aquiradiocola TaxID=393059 RepID=UPI001E5080BE|nr:ferric reductase-like transmembrane domain-containing protein [Deinococcus aquiradiocola]